MVGWDRLEGPLHRRTCKVDQVMYSASPGSVIPRHQSLAHPIAPSSLYVLNNQQLDCIGEQYEPADNVQIERLELLLGATTQVAMVDDSEEHHLLGR